MYTAPIEQPRNVLDVGCGTGIWAKNFAAAHPNSTVTGIDLTPPTPETAEDANIANCHFLKADAEGEWNFAKPGSFDLIHARLLASGMQDWPKFYRHCYEYVKPGGWVEVPDVTIGMKSETNEWQPSNSPSRRWWDHFTQGALQSGHQLDHNMHHGQHMEEAGFKNVQGGHTPWRIFLSEDPSNDERELVAATVQMFEDFVTSNIPLLKRSKQTNGLTDAEVEELSEQTREDMRKNGQRYRLYIG